MEKEQQQEKEKKAIKPAQAIAGFIVILILIAIVGWWMWPRGPSTVTATIQITCSTGWSGSIGANAQSTTVEGSGSRSYPVTGSIIVAVIQKQTEGGSLTVRIIVNGETKASQTTTAAYGVVTVSWSP